MNICIRNKGLITGNIRNRGNKELPKQSNCSVHQGTKVSSAEEHNQMAKFLFEKAQECWNSLDLQAFEEIVALLIYGLANYCQCIYHKLNLGRSSQNKKEKQLARLTEKYILY